jgi:transaldolase
MKKIEELNIKIFADGADKVGMLEMYAKPYIRGLTTNPSLIKSAGITNYSTFCQDILRSIPDKPISFEVLSDNIAEMELQALEISSWGDHVYVKIPITNTRRESCQSLIKRLATQKVKLNVTALMTLSQVRDVVAVLDPHVPSYVSVFAGRIADTGRDPIPLMAAAVELVQTLPAAELIWASTRELLNIFQANAIGCHIITASNSILHKINLIGKDLNDQSLEAVKLFHRDIVAAGLSL